MLTRFVRIQLGLFAVTGIVGVLVMGLVYLQVPMLLGLGRTDITVELPATGGLYRFSNVTLRGVQIGKVTSVDLQPNAVVATLSIDPGVAVPADVMANVRSVSAVGEQYIDLVPRRDSGSFLGSGATIPARDVTVPDEIGPILDQASALLATIDQDRLGHVVDDFYRGLAGAGYDLGSLIDSGSALSADLNRTAASSQRLVDNSVPLLDSQVLSADALQTWSRSLAGVTDQLNRNDGDIRRLLSEGPGFAAEVSSLLEQVKPTLPILLANLTSLGQVGVTYRPSIEQLLVLVPMTASGIQSYAMPNNNPTGIPLSDFGISIADPAVCTVGFLPPSQWRSPEDVSEIDTPDGLYCKLPQDSPISVRGARNAPCMGHPGKRAPTVQICNSDQPYRPLAMRQHSLGPYPIDPNLIAQGIPPDDRATEGEHLYAPVEGTPPPPLDDIAPPADSAVPGSGAPIPTDPAAPAPPSADAPSNTAPAAYHGPAGESPSVAVVPYNTSTGQYASPSGQFGAQMDVVTPAATWQEMMPR